MVKRYQQDKPKDVTTPLFLVWSRGLVGANEAFNETLWTNASSLLNHFSGSHPTQCLLFTQGFEIAEILAELKVDNHTLVAAILYPFVNVGLVSLENIESHVSTTVAKRISGVETMNAIRSLQTTQTKTTDQSHIDNLRKMLLVMVDDVRVVLLKLAERLSALRQAKTLPGEEKRSLAIEIADVFSPLANRLGVGQLKWEMEDLAFRYLHPSDYREIARNLDEKRLAREGYVDKVLAMIAAELESFQIKADLMGRAKHIYSIWKKMQRKQVGFDEIYDVRAVRILVPEIRDCYTALGSVHGLWKHIPKEFDDYIATPKENGYRSLHTAVIGPEGKTLEIQIRTFDMHQESELGVAAHWKYKEGATAPSDGYEAKIAWLRQLLDWQDEVVDSNEHQLNHGHLAFNERIYVFTPQGKLIDLPQGATALDFAYRVHTEIGHRCRGAKANGRIITLTQPLQTGQKIEILTSKTGAPSRDWLSEHRGYVRSARARNKINQWFRYQDKDKNIAAGKALLEKELAKHNIRSVDTLKLAKHFNYNKDEELFAGIGVGDKGLHQVINVVRTQKGLSQNNLETLPLTKQSKKTTGKNTSDVLVEGVGNLLTRMAGCCKPAPGDEIAGYVSQNRGVMIHREDCRYLLTSRLHSPAKVLRVAWAGKANQTYLIDLVIKAYDRRGLLGDITTLMANEKISVTELHTQVNQKRLMVNINMQIEVVDTNAVSKLITQIEQLANIVQVARKS